MDVHDYSNHVGKTSIVSDSERLLHDLSNEFDLLNLRVSTAEGNYASIQASLDFVNQEIETINSSMALADKDMQTLHDALLKLKGRLGTQNVRAAGAVRLLIY